MKKVILFLLFCFYAGGVANLSAAFFTDQKSLIDQLKFDQGDDLKQKIEDATTDEELDEIEASIEFKRATGEIGSWGQAAKNFGETVYNNRPLRHPAIGKSTGGVALFTGLLGTSAGLLFHMRKAAYNSSKLSHDEAVDQSQKNVIKKREEIKERFDADILDQKEIDLLMDQVDQMESKLKKMKKKKVVRSWKSWKNACTVEDSSLKTAYKHWLLPASFLLAVQSHKDFINENYDFEAKMSSLLVSVREGSWDKFFEKTNDLKEWWYKKNEKREDLCGFIIENFLSKSSVFDAGVSALYVSLRELESVVADKKKSAEKKSKKCTTWDVLKKYKKLGKQVSKKRIAGKFAVSFMMIRALHIFVDALNDEDSAVQEFKMRDWIKGCMPSW